MEFVFFYIAVFFCFALLVVSILGYEESRKVQCLEGQVHHFKEAWKLERSDSEVTITKLREDYAALESLHNQLQARHKDIVDKLAASAVNLVRVEKELEERDYKVRDLKQRLDLAIVQRDNSYVERDRLKHELEKCRQDHAAVCELRDSATQNYHFAKEETAEALNDNAKLRKEVDSYRDAIELINSRLREAQIKVKEQVSILSAMAGTVPAILAKNDQPDGKVSTSYDFGWRNSLIVNSIRDPAKKEFLVEDDYHYPPVINEVRMSTDGFLYRCISLRGNGTPIKWERLF